MSTRKTLKSIPFLVPLVRGARNLRARAIDSCKRFLKKDHAKEVFTEIYKTNYWGDPESVSGRGSSRAWTGKIKEELPALLAELEIRTLVDAPCGDFGWMSEIVDQIGIYEGVDIVPELVHRNQQRYGNDHVKFSLGDITKDQLPAGDAVLCRDCMIHLPFPLIKAALRNFKAMGYKYILLTHDEGVTREDHREIVTGDCRSVNWLIAPFEFPAPLAKIDEVPELGRYLAVWKLDELRI